MLEQNVLDCNREWFRFVCVWNTVYVQPVRGSNDMCAEHSHGVTRIVNVADTAVGDVSEMSCDNCAYSVRNGDVLWRLSLDVEIAVQYPGRQTARLRAAVVRTLVLEGR